jgi:Tol biopolymer transport system component
MGPGTAMNNSWCKISFFIVLCALFTACGNGGGGVSVRSSGGSTQNNAVVTPAANTSALVSAGLNGLSSDGASAAASVSADGRYVAFESNASNLTALDTNGLKDIFVRDLNTGIISLVSVSSAGVQGNGPSSAPAISADGRYVAFASRSTNLITPAANGLTHIFLRDLTGGTTSLVSVSSAGVQGNSISSAPAISADGSFVAFESRSTNLVTPASNGLTHIFLRDLSNNTTSLLSVDTTGSPGNGSSFAPSISPDGKYVAFESYASNLTVGDINALKDIFVRDLDADKTVLISTSSKGLQGNNDSSAPTISADGIYVAFQSSATNLVPLGTTGVSHIFVHDLSTGTTGLVSTGPFGDQGNAGSYAPAITEDGGFIAYESNASNLTLNDTNTLKDIFIYMQ